MRFKANKDQLEAVVKMLGMMLDSFPAETIEEEVFEEIVNKIFIRLQAKSLQIYCNKNSWAFSLNAIEAKCIHIFCKNTYLDEVNYHYEAHQLRKIFNEIDKIYGRIKAKNSPNRGIVTESPVYRLDRPSR
ncbi:hypothetical protein [Pedobacter sp. D749]|uniref:hypothetical protein n=1 Tax=Pedobacter sp. D749 TaxID=2856523 RepID=UPI001C560AC9|nr:hypothetical protein [Pedobacter sp. D749]QXU42069.1 hypothetical protein KYH19_00250 [Pedobacter sp. D749]